jgi:hypothetical protein
MVKHRLLAGGRVHQRARHLVEGRRLVGHGIGDDGRIVHRHGDRLADADLIQAGRLQVVERGRQAGADAIGRLGQIGGDGQVLLLPQVLDVGVELLADIHLTGLQRGGAGGVVLEDRVRQVLRRGQLAPHAGILPPVVVIAHVDDLGVVGEELVIRAGVDDVFGGSASNCGGVAADARFQRLRPGFLDDVVGAHVGGDEQRIDCRAISSSFALITTVCGSTASMSSM